MLAINDIEANSLHFINHIVSQNDALYVHVIVFVIETYTLQLLRLREIQSSQHRITVNVRKPVPLTMQLQNA